MIKQARAPVVFKSVQKAANLHQKQSISSLKNITLEQNKSKDDKTSFHNREPESPGQGQLPQAFKDSIPEKIVKKPPLAPKKTDISIEEKEMTQSPKQLKKVKSQISLEFPIQPPIQEHDTIDNFKQSQNIKISTQPFQQIKYKPLQPSQPEYKSKLLELTQQRNEKLLNKFNQLKQWLIQSSKLQKNKSDYCQQKKSVNSIINKLSANIGSFQNAMRSLTSLLESNSHNQFSTRVIVTQLIKKLRSQCQEWNSSQNQRQMVQYYSSIIIKLDEQIVGVTQLAKAILISQSLVIYPKTLDTEQIDKQSKLIQSKGFQKYCQDEESRMNFYFIILSLEKNKVFILTCLEWLLMQSEKKDFCQIICLVSILRSCGEYLQKEVFNQAQVLKLVGIIEHRVIPDWQLLGVQLVGENSDILQQYVNILSGWVNQQRKKRSNNC